MSIPIQILLLICMAILAVLYRTHIYFAELPTLFYTVTVARLTMSFFLGGILGLFFFVCRTKFNKISWSSSLKILRDMCTFAFLISLVMTYLSSDYSVSVGLEQLYFKI